MAKFIVGDGIQNYIEKFEGISDPVPAIKYAVHEGARVVADAVRSEIESIPTYGRGGPDPEGRKISSSQKTGLLDGFGVSGFQNTDGFINVKLGFDGYNKTVTKNYPQGQPNAMIARSLISGTSFRAKNDFIGRAVRRTKASAEKTMANALDDYYKNKME